jgi:predicted small secreted protein
MRYIHRHTRSLAALVVLALLVAACASTGIGKAIQTADLQKYLVEASAVEFAKLHFTNDPRITPEVYQKGKDAYTKWAAAQNAEARALATWKTVSNAPNEQQLKLALELVKASADQYLALIGQFVDLKKLKQ